MPAQMVVRCRSSVTWRGHVSRVSRVGGCDERMAGARYDEDIMAEFSKIERMIAEQVGGSFNHNILRLKCFHILKIFPPNLLTINPDPADECQSFPLRKLSGLFIDNFRLMTPFTGLRISRGRTTRSSTGWPGWRSGWPGPSTPGTCSTTGGRHSTSQVRPGN